MTLFDQILQSARRHKLHPDLGMAHNLHVLAPDKDPSFLVDVSGDGHCLFYAISIGYLFPVVHEPIVFKQRFTKLFGRNESTDPEEVRSILSQFKGGADFFISQTGSELLQHLATFPLRQRVANYIRRHPHLFINDPLVGELSEDTLENHLQEMTSTSTAWGGREEIIAFSRMLNVNIHIFRGETHEYYSAYDDSDDQESLEASVVNVLDAPEHHSPANPDGELNLALFNQNHYKVFLDPKDFGIDVAAFKNDVDKTASHPIIENDFLAISDIESTTSESETYATTSFLGKHWGKILFCTAIAAAIATTILTCGIILLPSALIMTAIIIGSALGGTVVGTAAGMIKDALAQEKYDLPVDPVSENPTQRVYRAILAGKRSSIDMTPENRGNYTPSISAEVVDATCPTLEKVTPTIHRKSFA